MNNSVKQQITQRKPLSDPFGNLEGESKANFSILNEKML